MSGNFIGVWFNGEFVRDGGLAIEPVERGLLLGDGLFETIAVFDGRAVWLDEHLARMMAAAIVIGLDIARDEIRDAAAEVLAKAKGRQGILRITVTRGAGGRGLAAADSGEPNLLITLAPWISGSLFREARLVTSSVCRNERSPSSRIKSLSYIDNILAARGAAAEGADDALMLNTRARIASSTIANVFILEPGRLVTPPVSEGVLPGIVRQRVLALAPRLGLKALEAPLSAYRAQHAEGMFLTNSLRLVRPVSRLDGTVFSEVLPSMENIYSGLCEAIAAQCGIDPRDADRT